MTEKDHFIRSWEGVMPYFYGLGRVFETRARKRSLALAELRQGSSILIIAPPTEYFVDTLLAANADGSNHFVYFSGKMKKRGDGRLHDKNAQTAIAESFDRLPYENDSFDKRIGIGIRTCFYGHYL